MFYRWNKSKLNNPFLAFSAIIVAIISLNACGNSPNPHSKSPESQQQNTGSHQPNSGSSTNSGSCTNCGSPPTSGGTNTNDNSSLHRISSRISNLINNDKLQEAIWIANDEGDTQTAQELKATLATTLRSSNYTVQDMSLGGVSNKTVLRFGNRIQAIFKPDGGTGQRGGQWAASANSEIAAYELDQLLGLQLVPMTINFQYNGELGSLQYFIENTQAGLGRSNDNFINLQVFDYIIGNPDRHGGNWLCWQSENRIVAIDHGLSFRDYEGGCFSNSILYIGSGSPCKHWATVWLIYFLRGIWINNAEPLELSRLSANVAKNITSLSDIAVDAALSHLVRTTYLNKLKVRLHLLQAELRN